MRGFLLPIENENALKRLMTRFLMRGNVYPLPDNKTLSKRLKSALLRVFLFCPIPQILDLNYAAIFVDN